jgi:hypothetical protein
MCLFRPIEPAFVDANVCNRLKEPVFECESLECQYTDDRVIHIEFS